MFFKTNKSKNTFSQTLRKIEKSENEKDDERTIFEISSKNLNGIQKNKFTRLEQAKKKKNETLKEKKN